MCKMRAPQAVNINCEPAVTRLVLNFEKNIKNRIIIWCNTCTVRI